MDAPPEDAGDPYSFQVADDIEDADLHDEDIGQQKRGLGMLGARSSIPTALSDLDGFVAFGPPSSMPPRRNADAARNADNITLALGIRLYHGQGVPQDHDEAYFSGSFYMQGIGGLPQDASEALLARAATGEGMPEFAFFRAQALKLLREHADKRELPIKELKRRLDRLKISYAGVLEHAGLVALHQSATEDRRQ
ncbi:hypothetical protein T492DRAFT_872434 [Pavlovales sp. CCMP2436]|nr:hypothetical protein T492DRAFT_872434 [Pavlovales sp. CCMP2436]